MLLHENTHRGHRETQHHVESGDMLFHYPFTFEEEYDACRAANELSSAELKRIASEAPSRIVKITGAITELWCSTEVDFQLKKIAESGYDLNEAIVEMLIQEQIHSLVQILRIDHTNRASRVEGPIQASGSSAKYKKYEPKVYSYFEDLGLNGLEEAYGAFMGGQIPLLHAQRYNSPDYFL